MTIVACALAYISLAPLSAADCGAGAAAGSACPRDCDGNARDDACEILEGPEADCNQNGLLDACERENDRNGNGFPDDCDLQAGRSLDCNLNGVPDEVESDTVLRFPVAAMQHESARVVGAADMDQDGDLDLIASSRSPDCSPRSGVAIIFNLGGFAFQEGPTMVLGDFVSFVTHADLDRDGDVDLVAAHSDGRGPEKPRVTPLFNQGRGRLNPGESFAISFVPLSTSRVADTDFDGDSDLVLLGGGSLPEVALYWNDGRGRFAAGPGLRGTELGMASSPRALAAADFDADGDQDFAAAAFGSGQIIRLVNEGAATLRAATLVDLGRPVAQIEAADLDSDGDQDLAAATEFRDGDLERSVIGVLHVLDNQGAGEFLGRPPLDLGARIEALLFADLDLDGDADMIGTHASPHHASLFVWTNQGDGQLADRARVAGPGRCVPVQAADLDLDGRLDVLLADAGRTAVAWALASQILGPPSILAHREQVTSLAFADLDGDGDTDLAAAGAFQVLLIANEGGRLFSPRGRFPVGSDPLAIAAGDFNADGKPDLATLNAIGGNVSVLVNQGEWTFAAPRHYAVQEDPGRVRAADLDGDGKDDLAITAFNEAAVLLLRSRGDGSFAAPVPIATEGSVYDVVAVDLDNDLDLDLAVTQRSQPPGGVLSVFRNGGEGSFSLAASYAGGEPSWVAAGDLDGDGDRDLVLGNSTSGLSRRLNLGDGSLGAPVEALRFMCSDGVQILDADGDGDLDLAGDGCNWDLVLAVNRGDGVFEEVRHGGVGLTSSFQLLDLDGDGDREVVGLTFEGGEGVPDEGGDIVVLEDLSGPLSRDEDQNGVPDECREPPDALFRRGDLNGDGKLDITDPVVVLRSLFAGEAASCRDAADANDDGRLELTDAVVILLHLFAGGAPLPAPPDCGRDPTLDAIECETFPSCRSR